MKSSIVMLKVGQLDATDLFGEDNINWQYCDQHAVWKHQHAAEFMINCDNEMLESQLTEMQAFGCTQDFMDAVKAGFAAGLNWLILFA